MKTMKRTKRILGLVWLTFGLAILPGARSASALTGTGGYDGPYFQADFIQELSDWSSSPVNPALLYRVNQFHLSGGQVNVRGCNIEVWPHGLDDAF